MIHQKSGGKNSWDLIYWVLLNYSAASSIVYEEIEAEWISMSQAVMSMNWETHCSLNHFLVLLLIHRYREQPDWVCGDESQSNSEPAVILYTAYTKYFCWLLHDISKVAGKPGHLLHGAEINRKHRGKQVKLTSRGKDSATSKFAQLRCAAHIHGNILFSVRGAEHPIRFTEKYEARGNAAALCTRDVSLQPRLTLASRTLSLPSFPCCWGLPRNAYSWNVLSSLTHRNSPFHECSLSHHWKIAALHIRDLISQWHDFDQTGFIRDKNHLL